MLHDYEFKRKLALGGIITDIQPYQDDKITFFVEDINAFYLYHPKTQRTQKFKIYNSNVQDLCSYLIDDKQKYLIINQIINKVKWNSIYISLDSKQVHRRLKQTQIIGVQNQITIALILKAVGLKLKVKLKKSNQFRDTLYKTLLCTSKNLHHFCFDTTFGLLQTDLLRCWVFLQNNRRIQFAQSQFFCLPYQNFTKNKNYYLFGIFRKEYGVKFIVRQHTQLKIVRKIFFKNCNAIQIGKWLYVIEKERWLPLRRINLTNCKVQDASENLSAIKMCRTNDSKYLVFSKKCGLYTLKSLRNE